MKKKLFYSIVLTALMLNTIISNVAYSSSNRSANKQHIVVVASHHIIPKTIKVYPVEAVRRKFENGFLGRRDYSDPDDVCMAQQYISKKLCPGRPDLFELSVCTLGECLKNDERYSKQQVDRAVNLMLNFRR